jgi:hypothetical protein
MADIHRAAYYVRAFNKAGVDWYKLVPADAVHVSTRSCQLGSYVIVRDRTGVWQAVSRVGLRHELRGEQAA